VRYRTRKDEVKEMTTTTRPKETTISEAQARLAQLDEEEASIEGHLEAKEQELAEAEESGNFQLAAALSAEVNYLKGQGNHSQRDRIQRDRQAATGELRDGLDVKLNDMADNLESRIPAQKEKEDKAMAQLEAVSGCQWMPKQTRVESQGRPVTHTDRPLSQQWQDRVNHWRQMAGVIRGINPATPGLQQQLKTHIKEALSLISNPETE
jgi:hypothetical protein